VPQRGSDARAVSIPAQQRTAKAEQTRGAIVEAALRLFRENGYEATTMRAIAQEAGVATGNAYYYFSSKETLVQELYARNQAEHGAAVRPVLDSEARLGPRLRGTLRTLIDTQAAYHDFGGKLYSSALEPSAAKDAAVAVFGEVVSGSRSRVPADLRERLPELLWLYSMGVTLYWSHDTSPECANTYRLIEVTVPLAERLIMLSRLPLLGSVTRQVAGIAVTMRQ
jgi:AcrR family transcriptional regulator